MDNDPDLTSFPPPHPRDQRVDHVDTPQQRPEPANPGPPPPPVASLERKPQGTFARGFGWGTGIATGVAVVGTALSLLSLVGLWVMAAALLATGGQQSEQTTVVWGSGSDRLRAIEISGAIMAESSDGSLLSAGTYGYEVARELDGLSKDDGAGVVLLVNTPGGSIAGSKAISDAIERYQERTGQKVLVHISSMSASGGVYSTAPADEIIADYGSLVGSIGVVFGPFTHYQDVTGTTGTLLESGVTTTGGVTQEYLSQGTGKDFGNPFRAMTEREREVYMGGLKREYDAFVSHVAEHRGIEPKTIVDDLGAFMFDPVTAQEKKLIDSVMGREEFFRHAAETAGLNPDNTSVEALSAPSGLETLLGVERRLGLAPAATQGDGVTPVLSSAICGGGQPLVLAGDLRALCG